MKILHTSDWHLGKYLDKYSRIEEQEMFLNELHEICEKQKIDLIIIAGDIYDTSNPPINAEKLFFSAMKKLSKNGSRPIIIIPGNHDSSSKLLSPRPLASEFGIIIQGNIDTIASCREYDGFKIVNAGEGFLELSINNENIILITIPYITEKSINKIIFSANNELDMQKNYSDKVKEILDNLKQNFKEDTINIIVSHLFVRGSIESDSERKIQAIGGSYAVDGNIFPKEADYVALGHLHRMQKVKNDNTLIYYSGSPIRYSQSETNYDKCVLILDIEKNKHINIEKYILKDYKPIIVLKCDSYNDALEKCIKINEENSYVFIEITSETGLNAEEIRNIRETKNDIVSIIVKSDKEEKVYYEVQEEKSILEQFKDFYIHKKNLEPREELLNEFLNILNEIENEEGESFKDETIYS